MFRWGRLRASSGAQAAAGRGPAGGPAPSGLAGLRAADPGHAGGRAAPLDAVPLGRREHRGERRVPGSATSSRSIRQARWAGVAGRSGVPHSQPCTAKAGSPWTKRKAWQACSPSAASVTAAISTIPSLVVQRRGLAAAGDREPGLGGLAREVDVEARRSRIGDVAPDAQAHVAGIAAASRPSACPRGRPRHGGGSPARARPSPRARTGPRPAGSAARARAARSAPRAAPDRHRGLGFGLPALGEIGEPGDDRGGRQGRRGATAVRGAARCRRTGRSSQSSSSAGRVSDIGSRGADANAPIATGMVDASVTERARSPDSVNRPLAPGAARQPWRARRAPGAPARPGPGAHEPLDGPAPLVLLIAGGRRSGPMDETMTALSARRAKPKPSRPAARTAGYAPRRPRSSLPPGERRDPPERVS